MAGTLSFEFRDFAGNRRTGGTVLVVPSEPFRRDTTRHVVLSGTASVKIPPGTTGPVTVSLPATDDPTLDPAGCTYTVIPPKGWGPTVAGVVVLAGTVQHYTDL